LMSGTSADGIDAALVRLEGEGAELVAFNTEPWPFEVAEQILRLAQPTWDDLEVGGRLNHRIAQHFAEAARKVVRSAGLKPEQILFVGSHGQTVRHQPQGRDRFTWQLGHPSIVAALTGWTTVGDFRMADMGHGGQGAPLMPAFHRALFTEHPGLLVLNLGGIANLTWLGNPLLGWDTGPANMGSDLIVTQATHGRLGFDEGGAMALEGRVIPELLALWQIHPFFKKKPPTSTGREAFGQAWLESWWPQFGDRPMVDLLATYVDWVAWSVAKGIGFLPEPPTGLCVVGGGRHNRALVEAIETRTGLHRVEAPLDSDAIEAAGFAWLGWRSLRGLAGNAPSVTGARQAIPLGLIAPGANWPQLARHIAGVV